jgi:thioredoxin-like negative regulator of GroEL
MLRGLLAELEAKYQQLKNAPLKDDKLGQLKKEVEADPTNLESKFKLAQLYTEKELLEEGLQLLLEVPTQPNNRL